MLGISALRTNRPDRAVEVMSQGDVTGRWEEKWVAYWQVYASALHANGQLEDALEVIGRGERVLPDALLRDEIQTRAALGQGREVGVLIDRAFTVPGLGVLAAIDAALEYRAHGHPEAAAAPLQRALDWLSARPSDERATSAHRFDAGRVLYWSDRWDEALPLFEELAQEDPTVPDRLGFLGTTLARLGRRQEAVAVAEQLAALGTPYLYGKEAFWRAKIRAILGDSAEAVVLIRQAIGEGLGFGGLHPEPDFESLSDYAPFVELMRPRG